MIASLTNTLSGGVERSLMTIGGLVGAAFSFAFGDVAPLMLWLMIFVVADMVTGMLAAVRNHSWCGKVLFWGVIRKVVMFSIIALAHGLDMTLHDLIHIDFVQSVVIVAYTAGEFGSVIKNLEKAGLGSIIPPVLRYILYAINQYLEERASKTLPIKLHAPNKKDEIK
ncbi:phage holin family protein [Parasutterella secunda]|uniref:Phage holin family protein n=1 Tax=Parasutterella secunda TaxID=626947 RepID=A0ABS2GS50_9BURK|nr:phage holin family protein [Parasutterella secunda]MBM6928184.1 phage holin family protein [Parasutterella secunda]